MLKRLSLVAMIAYFAALVAYVVFSDYNTSCNGSIAVSPNSDCLTTDGTIVYREKQYVN